MTNLDDALVAVDAGADAVGFVFYEKSPRYVTVETAQEICARLPESVEKVGVFVSKAIDPIEVLFRAGLTGTQYYLTQDGLAGCATRSGAMAIARDALPARFRYVLAFPMSLFSDPATEIVGMLQGFAKSRDDTAKITSMPEGLFDTFLLDSGSIGRPGGTGESFNWEKAGPIGESVRQHGMKLVVAGGLKPDNVAGAISILKPWGVDVVSGVEASPGKKDPEKVRAFVRAVREMDRKVG